MQNLNKWILEIRGLVKHFGGVNVINDLTFQIKAGSISAIVGPNGSGKSTLFNLIGGFIDPDAGEIIFNGSKITGRSPDQVARMGVARTFQVVRVFPMLTVMENMLLAIEKPAKEGIFYGLNPFKRYSSSTLEKSALKILAIGALENKRDEYAANLSHGQQRLLEVLRAVARGGLIYLFDEPTAGVFPEIRDRMAGIFRHLKNLGYTVLLVEHNMEVVTGVAERLMVLDRGQLVAEGTPGNILRLPEVISAYFGEGDVA